MLNLGWLGTHTGRMNKGGSGLSADTTYVANTPSPSLIPVPVTTGLSHSLLWHHSGPNLQILPHNFSATLSQKEKWISLAAGDKQEA